MFFFQFLLSFCSRIAPSHATNLFVYLVSVHFFWKIIFCLICHNHNYKFVYFYKTPIERFELFFFKCRTQIGFFKEHQVFEIHFCFEGKFLGLRSSMNMNVHFPWFIKLTFLKERKLVCERVRSCSPQLRNKKRIFFRETSDQISGS